MRLNSFVIFFLLFFVGLCPGCDSGPTIEPLARDAVILAFGDSLTHGTGAQKEQSYPSILSGLLERKVLNAGIPGEVSAAGRNRLSDELEKHNPDLVVLCHGGNDFLRRLDQEKTAENLRSMVELIQASGADVILLGVPKLGWGLAVPDFYSEMAKELKIPFEGEILVDLLGDNSMKSDTIHPNATGYRLMAEAIHEVINKAQK